MWLVFLRMVILDHAPIKTYNSFCCISFLAARSIDIVNEKTTISLWYTVRVYVASEMEKIA